MESTLSLDFISENIAEVQGRIQNAIERRDENIVGDVCLVAVSKTKPSTYILEAYKGGHKHFGENYIQELVTKAQELEPYCPDIQWHFIGHLQSNKVNKLISVGRYLIAVETVDSEKLAGSLNTQRKKWIDADPETRKDVAPLKVFVQVNTSGEEVKGGVNPGKVEDVVDFIIKECPTLKFHGLMTIGRAYVDDPPIPNPDFDVLCKARDSVCSRLKLDPIDVVLSMGMSGDFEQAILQGSRNVRVGSTIFGKRNYNKS